MRKILALRRARKVARRVGGQLGRCDNWVHTTGNLTMAEVHVCVKTDFPPAESVVKLAGTADVPSFVRASAVGCGLEEDGLERYTGVLASFKTDAQKFPLDSTASLEEVGVTSGSSVLFFAPSDMKPVRKRHKGKKGKKKGGDSDSEDGSDSEEEEEEDSPEKKYRGLTVTNVLGKWKKAKGKPKTLALEFIEIHAKKIFATKEWDELPGEDVKTILKQNRLNAREMEVFQAALRWGRAEAKREDKKEDELRDVLEKNGVFQQVRFPAMETQQIALKVSPLKLLKQSELLDLFTFMGLKSSKDDAVPPSSLKFPYKPRNPRSLGSLVKWDIAQSFTRNLYTTEKNERLVRKSQQTGTIYVCREKTARSKGTHRFVFKVVSNAGTDSCDGIGFANQSYNYNAAWLGGSGAILIQPGGTLKVDNVVIGTPGAYTTGSTVTFELNIDKRKGWCQVNKGSKVNFNWGGMQTPVYAALCFRQVGWAIEAKGD